MTTHISAGAMLADIAVEVQMQALELRGVVQTSCESWAAMCCSRGSQTHAMHGYHHGPVRLPATALSHPVRARRWKSEACQRCSLIGGAYPDPWEDLKALIPLTNLTAQTHL